ncbi:S8 family serine peptidase [Gemmatimonas groenlandica]|uniref:S8 family serine peptidase n=2 Tax=Gemmatimonas groenlandica TaxID=2732249 RepID=A0A6M4IXK0_9BACT|nr:S8 family serine peptidase [Gemmatimonas groenlandica]
MVVAACSPEQTSLTSPADASLAAAPQASVARAPEFVPGEVIVRFRAGASNASRGEIMRSANAQVGEKIVTAAMRGRGDNEGISVLRTSMNVPDAIAALKARADVEYAEPNWIYTTDATVSDTYYSNGSLWGMYGSLTDPANQYGIGGNSGWAAGANCGDVVIGIIDEGYMYTHPELAGNAFTNPGETAGNGVDDDGNGYVDDVYGWDFAGNNNSVFDGAGDDHGTHVAGTIGAAGNGTGVVGVCSKVKLMSGKFLGSQGGTTANAVKAVDYFTALKNKGVNIVATSNSWGGGGASTALEAAIERANAAGVLFIAAAGNSTYNCETTACFPANYANANVISVASITSAGALSSFSNYGATKIDIGAPGSGIWSTVPVASRGKNVVAGYASYSGTSMATPHVSGAAAYYAFRHPGSSASDIKAAIIGSAIPTASLSGKVVSNGRLNVAGF